MEEIKIFHFPPCWLKAKRKQIYQQESLNSYVQDGISTVTDQMEKIPGNIF